MGGVGGQSLLPKTLNAVVAHTATDGSPKFVKTCSSSVKGKEGFRMVVTHMTGLRGGSYGGIAAGRTTGEAQAATGPK